MYYPSNKKGKTVCGNNLSIRIHDKKHKKYLICDDCRKPVTTSEGELFIKIAGKIKSCCNKPNKTYHVAWNDNKDVMKWHLYCNSCNKLLAKLPGRFYGKKCDYNRLDMIKDFKFLTIGKTTYGEDVWIS